jgi:hypothetical protein
MLQYYLCAEGLALSWTGTGRIIFSLNYTEQDLEAVANRFVAAAKAMQETAGGGSTLLELTSDLSSARACGLRALFLGTPGRRCHRIEGAKLPLLCIPRIFAEYNEGYSFALEKPSPIKQSE